MLPGMGGWEAKQQKYVRTLKTHSFQPGQAFLHLQDGPLDASGTASYLLHAFSGLFLVLNPKRDTSDTHSNTQPDPTTLPPHPHPIPGIKFGCALL